MHRVGGGGQEETGQGARPLQDREGMGLDLQGPAAQSQGLAVASGPGNHISPLWSSNLAHSLQLPFLNVPKPPPDPPA